AATTAADISKQRARWAFLLNSITANMAGLLFHMCRNIAAFVVLMPCVFKRLRCGGAVPASCGCVPVSVASAGQGGCSLARSATQHHRRLREAGGRLRAKARICDNASPVYGEGRSRSERVGARRHIQA